MNVELWRNDTDREKLKHSEKNLSQWYFLTKNLIWTEPKSDTTLQGVGPEGNHVIHGMTWLLLKLMHIKYSVLTSLRTQCTSVTKTNQVMLYRKMMVVYWKNNTECINCVNQVWLLILHLVYHTALRVVRFGMYLVTYHSVWGRCESQAARSEGR
jgi:hypothetical protein